MNYAKWLDAKRRAAGMTQEQLADAAKVRRSYVNRIIKGHVNLPNLETRLKFHAALGTTEDELRELGIVPATVIRVPTAEATVAALPPTVERRDTVPPDVAGLTPAHREAVRALVAAGWSVAPPGQPLPGTPFPPDDPKAEVVRLLGGLDDGQARDVARYCAFQIAYPSTGGAPLTAAGRAPASRPGEH